MRSDDTIGKVLKNKTQSKYFPLRLTRWSTKRWR